MQQTRENIRAHHGWSDGLGDCLTDWKTCLSGMACMPIVTGQLVQRIYKVRMSCIILAVVLWLCALANLISQWYTPCGVDTDVNDDGRTTQSEIASVLDANNDSILTLNDLVDIQATIYGCEAEYYSSFSYALVSFFGSGFMAGTCFLTMLLRAHIRKRDSIPVTVCAGLDDCCCAIVCTPCVQCQLLRHEGLGNGRYDLQSPTGEINDGTQFHSFGEEL